MIISATVDHLNQNTVLIFLLPNVFVLKTKTRVSKNNISGNHNHSSQTFFTVSFYYKWKKVTEGQGMHMFCN